MRIHLWGTDFRRGNSEMRGKLYFAPEEREARLRKLLSLGFSDLVYLNTCNRVELYTTAPDHFTDTRPLWLRALAVLGMSETDYYRGYQLEGKAALRHLLRVACSLESLVVGEPQILGQLKDALAFSKEKNIPVDGSLERSFTLAFETAKKVRTETAIGEKPVSVATLGLKHLERMENEFPMSKVVVVGRSPINLAVIQWVLKNRPSCPILWVNRHVDALNNFAEAEKVTLSSLVDFLKSPPTFSHLFTATSSSEPIFGRAFFGRIAGRQLIFDFAQPPDVATPGCDCEAVLIQLEDLNEEARENAASRAVAVAAADHLIERSLKDYAVQQKQAPLLRDFSEVEPRFWNELQFALESLDKDFPPEVHPKIRKWAEKLVKKNLHNSREHLRFVLQKVADPDPKALIVL